jgi:hypothetical protein
MPTCQQVAKHSAPRFWHSNDSRSSLFLYLSTDLRVASVGRTIDPVATGLPYLLLTDSGQRLQLSGELGTAQPPMKREEDHGYSAYLKNRRSQEERND